MSAAPALAAPDVPASKVEFAPKEVVARNRPRGSMPLSSPINLTGVVGETMDKDHVNQRGVLQRRAVLVEDFYANTPSRKLARRSHWSRK